MLNAAVIGCGYWGSHLVRNFNNSDKWILRNLCDIDESHLAKISNAYPGKIAVVDSSEIYTDADIDAIVIATPSSSHYELAKKALDSGKHVWVEKPFTMNSTQAQELIAIAQRKKLIINVDHTYIYTPAIRKIKEIIDSGALGRIIYFDAIRINLGLFQHDVNVIWDLAPHDISVINYLLGKKPISVTATGNSFYKYNKKELEEIAYITIRYEDDTLAHINVNWMSPVKIRQMIIGATDKMLIFDDMQTVEKIRVYDSGITLDSREAVYDSLVQYRIGDMYSPAVKNAEALETECTHFYDCIMSGTKTDTDGESGLFTVQVLEAADRSIKTGGSPIKL